MNVVMTDQKNTRLPLTDAALRLAFSASTLEAGRIYEMRGRVHDVVVSSDGTTVSAEVIGTAPKPYTQRIRLRDAGWGRLTINGGCTCPVGRNCKHIAAVLVAVQRQEAADALARGVGQSLPGPGKVTPLAKAKSPARATPEPRLPATIDTWLTELQRDLDDETEDYPDSIRHRLLYALGRDTARPGVPVLTVQPFNATLRKDGKLSHIRQYPANLSGNPARFLRPSDRLILSRLGRRPTTSSPARPEDDPADTLRRVLATGRAYWQQIEGSPLREGPPRAGRIAWELAADGTQRAMLALDDGLLAMRIPAPWYVDAETGEIGPVTLDLPIPLVSRLLAAPPIPAEAAAKVREEITRRLPSVVVPIPNEMPKPVAVPGPPQPRLRLMQGALPANFGYRVAYGRGEASLTAVPVARLSFEYGDISVPCSDQPMPRVFARNGALFEPVRDEVAEGRTMDELASLGLGRVSRLIPVWYRHAHSDDFAMVDDDAGADWLSFMLDDVPRLRDEGWLVEVDDDFPVRVVLPDGDFNAELIEGSGIDWLELHLGVMVGGERVDLIPALTRLIMQPNFAASLADESASTLTVKLPDGRLLALPMERLRPTLQALVELFDGGVIDPAGGRIGFSRLNAADLAGLEARAGLVWRGGEALRDLGRQLREAGGAIPAAVLPDSFKGTLRPYQARGVDWLQFLRAAGLGGVLADDMGLGKTVQTLAHLAIEKAAGRLEHPALIVCPTSLIPNWVAEAEKFAPGLTVLTLHGLARKERFGEIPKHDLVLTTYPLLARDHAVLTAQEWHVVVLDEAQTIKNPNAATTRQALQLKANQRLCLSGTPLQNHLGELWSLFDFLAPGFLGGQKSFRTRYRTPIEKHGDGERSDLLNRRVRPFLLRRTKQEVVSELPPKTEITDRIEMEDGQRAIYEGIRLAMHTRVQEAIATKGLAKSGIIILDALLKLRQACCDPRLLKLKTVAKSKAGSAKLDRLMEMLTVMFAEGRRVLLFSQFTEMLALIEKRLAEDKVEYVMLTGDTKDRGTPVRKFQKGEVPLFLISLKAGGVGLNLTAADTVIHYDPWWNPAVEDQATDRAHRIGQSKNVVVHRLVTVGPIEEKMEVLKDRKRALVASVMEAEHGGALKLTEADVEALFGAA